jgi:hypothetical protein
LMVLGKARLADKMSLWRCEHAAQIDAMASNCKFGFGSERELLKNR